MLSNIVCEMLHKQCCEMLHRNVASYISMFLSILSLVHHLDQPALPDLGISGKCQRSDPGDLLHLVFSDPLRSPGD